MPRSFGPRFGPNSTDPYRYVPAAMTAAADSVNAYGEMMQPDVLRSVGDAIGGMNAIGALRSGGTTVAMNDISRTYADRVGLYARQAAGDALNTGVGVGAQQDEMQFQRDQARQARRNSIMRAVGGVLGAGIGFAVGGPAGAVKGATAGTTAMG